MAAHLQPQVSLRSEPLTLQQLLAARADLWRGRAETSAVAEGIPTGFPALDQSLPWRGWPTDGLTEILTDQPGAGLALILPALTRLCAEKTAKRPDGHLDQHARSSARPQSKGWILLVNPPLIPYAPALEAEGLGLGDLVVIEAPGQGAWAMEQGLRIGGCAAVVAWSSGLVKHVSHQQDVAQDATWTTPVLRRLQLAAQTRSTPALLQRPASAAEQPSPAQLRLDCATSQQGLELYLRKLRGGRAGGHLRLSGPLQRVELTGSQDESGAVAR